MKIRLATKHDLPAIVAMLHDDDLGRTRESHEAADFASYATAFQSIQEDSNQELIVAVAEDGSTVGTLQLSFIPYLTYRGGLRAQVEAVRVEKARRQMGIGKLMFDWVRRRATKKGAHLIQLTTNKNRSETIEFYQSLGFRASHEGMKFHLETKSK